MKILQQKYAILELVLLGLTGLLLIFLIASDTSKYFIARTFYPYILVTGIFFVCWTINGIHQFDMYQPEKCTLKKILHLVILYGAFFCVAISAFQYKDMAFKNLKNNYVNVVTQLKTSNTMSYEELQSQMQYLPDQEVEQTKAQGQNLIPNTLVSKTKELLTGYYADTKHIQIDDTQLYSWMIEIMTNLQKYAGWTVTVTGQITKDPTIFEPGTFSPTRQLMTCCIADLSTVGFTCLYNATDPFVDLLKEDKWVTVTGIITEGTFNGFKEPQIQCTTVVSTQPPSDPYLYPFNRF